MRTAQSCPSDYSAVSSSWCGSESGKGLTTRTWKSQEWSLVSRAHLWGQPGAQHHRFLILVEVSISRLACWLMLAAPTLPAAALRSRPAWHQLFACWGYVVPLPSPVPSGVHYAVFLRLSECGTFPPNILSCLLERLRRGMGFEIVPSWVLVLPFTRCVIFEKITLISSFPFPNSFWKNEIVTCVFIIKWAAGYRTSAQRPPHWGAQQLSALSYLSLLLPPRSSFLYKWRGLDHFPWLADPASSE